MSLTFGERVVLARKRAKLSQEALGEAVNVHRNTVAGWEGPAATMPDGDAMVQLPAALRVSGHWLLTGEGDMRLPTGTEATRLRIAGRIASNELGEAILELLPILPRKLPSDLADEIQDFLDGPDGDAGESTG